MGRSVAGAPAPSERQLSALRREEIGFVFQFFHLLAELDGEANVLLPTTPPGADRGGAARGRALIAQLGLSDVAGLRPHQLSAASSSARAGAGAGCDLSLVLADELIGNLDATAGEVVLDLLRGVADQGRAVVMVTHLPEATARQTAFCGWRTACSPRPGWRAPRMSFALPHGMGLLRGRPGRSGLTAVGIAAAGLVLGVALTVAYALSTGFDRAADRADLPTIVARFDR